MQTQPTTKRKKNVFPMQLKPQEKEENPRKRIRFLDAPATTEVDPAAQKQEQLNDRQMSIQFLRRHKVEASTLVVPDYMKSFVPASLPTGTIKYECDLDERIERYQQLVLSLSFVVDTPHRRAHVRKEFKASQQRKVHYMRCKFLWLCKFVMEENTWKEAMGPVAMKDLEALSFADKKQKGHVDWSNMEAMLFGFDMSKFSDKNNKEMGANTTDKIKRWKHSMIAAERLCKRMKFRMTQ